MSDPRNVAHQKKVTQEKHHQKTKPATRRRVEKQAGATDKTQSVEAAPTTSGGENARAAEPADLEKSLAVLAKLKDLEFHARANIETLAQLSLTIEEELKQRECAEAIGAIYSAEEAFHSKVAAFIETYQAKCDGMKKPT